MPQPEPWMPEKRPPTKKEVWEWVKFHSQTAEINTGELIGIAQGMWAWAYTHWVNNSGWDKPPDWTPGDPICAWAIPSRINENDYEEAVCGLWIEQSQYVAERTAA